MAETWRAVPGWPAYSVSDQGRVQGPSGKVLRPQPVHDKIKGTRTLSDRVYQMEVELRSGGKRKKVPVHKIVLEAFVGPRPPGMECCHWDNDVANNTLANLRWGTSTENGLDKRRHGTRKGELNSMVRLTEREVLEIRSRWGSEAISKRELGRQYGISYHTVHSIVKGRRWQHI